MTCRVKRSKRPAMPTKAQPQLNSCQLKHTQNPKAKNWRCFVPNDGNGFMHYVVLNEVVLGEACVIEKCNEWISLAFIGKPEAVCNRAFVENHALVPIIAR
jgi:hypothetical protein